jgi:hypothetical protein
MSDQAAAVGLNVHQAADTFASMIDQDEGPVDTEEQAPSEEETEETEETESTELQDEVEESSEDEVADEEEETEEQESQPDKFVVKVNGEELEVTKDELLRGYQREADYTRKTQKLAEERRMVESEFQQVRAEREQYATVLVQLQQKLQEMAPAEPDWERLEAEDPIEYARQWTHHQRKAQQLAAVQQEQARLDQLRQEESRKSVQELLKKEAEAVREKIPEWKSPEKAKADGKALLEYGQSLGFSENELGEITDSRALLALYKAWQFDQMMSKKPQLQQKIKKAPKMAAPGSANATSQKSSEINRAKNRLANSGSVKDAAALFDKFI